MKRQPVLIATTLGGLLTSPAYAEVSDKVISVPEMLLWGVAVGAVGFMACRFRTRWIWATLPLGLLASAQGVATVHDRFVGPAIIQEAGVPYAIAAYGSLVLVALGNAAGYALGKKRATLIEWAAGQQ